MQTKDKKIRMIKRGQSVLEYSMIIAVAVAALMTMGVYVRRAVQANLKIIEEQINVEAVPETR